MVDVLWCLVQSQCMDLVDAPNLNVILAIFSIYKQATKHGKQQSQTSMFSKFSESNIVRSHKINGGYNCPYLLKSIQSCIFTNPTPRIRDSYYYSTTSSILLLLLLHG